MKTRYLLTVEIESAYGPGETLHYLSELVRGALADDLNPGRIRLTPADPLADLFTPTIT
jgi:hypothetical protein